MKRNQLLLPQPHLRVIIIAPRKREHIPPGVELAELPRAAFRFTAERGDRAPVFAVWEAGTGIGVFASRIVSHAGFPADVTVAAFMAAAVETDVDAAHRGGGGCLEDDGGRGFSAG
ncbi:hypothetical protein LTR12_000348 [Friedmanniomyces endolithicus]|nr:hypothetical protein LTR74_007801 [Friedmanniomyces endolithicus]KAK1825546.1 hypothetical protein LTR12_000348 [Friedmanniomyces endolithicus]